MLSDFPPEPGFHFVLAQHAAALINNIGGEKEFQLYQALYRKWRPKSFEDVVGQPHITKTLKSELEAGRIAHAYIFTGSRGTGKTTCARILAKAVNCLNPQKGEPCGECANCRGIDSGSLVDVVEIDAASNNGVDNIRDLREEAGYTPASAKYRVYIIDEAHMLSPGAFNALLKTLEEPPAYVIFILATTEAHKIPATIMSRCQRFDFRRIPADIIAERVKYVAAGENLEIDDDAAALIARLADGAMRNALSILDQCAGLPGRIDEAAVSAAAGLTGGEYLADMTRAILNGDCSAALEVVNGIYEASKDCERFCEELLENFRSLMIIKAVGDASYLNLTAPQVKQLKELSEGFTREALLHILNSLQDTLERLHKTPSKRVELELGVLRLCSPELDDSNAAVLRRIAALEEKLSGMAISGAATSGTAKSQAARPAQKQQKEEPPGVNPEVSEKEELQPQPAQPETAADEPLACWPEVLEVLYKIDPPFSGFLNGSSAIVRGNFVLVDAPNSMFADLIREQEHRKALIESVRKITGIPYKVGVFKKSLKEAGKSGGLLEELADNAASHGIHVEVF